MNFNDVLLENEKLTTEKTVSVDHATSAINEMFKTLIESVYPKEQVTVAESIVAKWKVDYKNDMAERKDAWDSTLSIHNDILNKVQKDNEKADVFIASAKQLKKIQQETSASDPNYIEKISQFLLNNPVPDLTITPIKELPNWDKAVDFSHFDELMSQSPLVLQLETFVFQSKKSLKEYRRTFNLLSVLLRVGKWTLFGVGFICSYVISDKLVARFGQQFQTYFHLSVQPIYLALLATVICYVTTDRAVERWKTNLFWYYANRCISVCRRHFTEFTNYTHSLEQLFRRYIENNKVADQ